MEGAGPTPAPLWREPAPLPQSPAPLTPPHTHVPHPGSDEGIVRSTVAQIFARVSGGGGADGAAAAAAATALEEAEALKAEVRERARAKASAVYAAGMDGVGAEVLRLEETNWAQERGRAGLTARLGGRAKGANINSGFEC